ncbi:hypothetical protein [Pseudanabaena sp. PCC 6802]|uniref:hypothetical protein n=1 Tax=Pseudanabaena sp. PCC 6802 TaxID=118173 RepID=UPI000347122B|nr:hypothetical protein [Pseudanabaena sp. PCC 6802]
MRLVRSCCIYARIVILTLAIVAIAQWVGMGQAWGQEWGAGTGALSLELLGHLRRGNRT